jgi:anaerobic selenocysteine-containing dehydrogenase
MPAFTLASPAAGQLTNFPPVERWDDWAEYDPTVWPKKVSRKYMLIPTVCFNCEAACGLLAYVDKETLSIRKFEGNPAHPGSRGRNCAKGPATINQVHDPERILYPLKRSGPRGSGKWQQTTWEEVLETFASRIRRALQENRRTEVMYHVGRPGHDGYMDRVLQAWGVDGHNSHTNVCSASARLGYTLWQGADRPSPDHANARFILLISAHLETGHYFNPHAQRIVEGMLAGAKVAVIDTRLSNTAARADYWLSAWPGSEAAVLLAMANIILQNERYNRAFMERWVNWETYLQVEHPEVEPTFDQFIAALKAQYAVYTPEFAERESGIAAAQIVQVAHEIANAGTAFATHIWRSAASGNEGGWQIARCLEFLSVLTGSVGTRGGTSPNNWDKFVAAPFARPTPQQVWSELLWPREYPLAHHEMSFLLPHFLKDGRGRVDTYFTRVYNPVWTNPDGATWIEVLQDEKKIALHAALTPVWSETAWFADYVLPMGNAAERHDLMSQETQAGSWIAFRQPVLKTAREKLGQPVRWTYEANPGEVWEEDEFWIELSWRIDPDGSLGVRKYFESPYRAGEKLTIDEYYQWIFEHSVPGLPEAAAAEGLTPLAYMRKYGAFEVTRNAYHVHEKPLSAEQRTGAEVDPLTQVIRKDGQAIGVEIDGQAVTGFTTPSRKLEFFSTTLKDWHWPEYAMPSYIKSHVHRDNIDHSKGEYVLLPTYRLPTLIHTRGGNSKWLYEISHTNPLWMHPRDAERLGLRTGMLAKVETEAGYFVNRVWETEAIRPGIVACSHHLGRWRLSRDMGGERWSTALADLKQVAPGQWRLRQLQGITPFTSTDPDSDRVWWTDAGVHQNLTFPVHPDPISGMHCWHQKVWIKPAAADERYGDVFVDTNKAFRVYQEWLKKTRPAPGPGGLRRPLWMLRPLKPAPEAYRLSE